MTNQEDKYWSIFKIILIGESGVGKSNLLTRLIENEFHIDTKTTVGVEFGAKEYEIDENIVKVQIWDTAGQERFRSITTTYFKGAQGALLVYDITRENTFDQLDQWIREFRQIADEQAIIILIGNKADLSHERNISVEAAVKFAEKRGLAYMETSARDNLNVEEAFEKLVKEIYVSINSQELCVDDNYTDTGNQPRIVQPQDTIKLQYDNQQKNNQKKGCC